MEHQIDAKRIHHAWDNTLEPTLRVNPGDVVHYELLMAGHGQVHEGDAFSDTQFDFDTLYNLLGPVHVEGAQPGDTLNVNYVGVLYKGGKQFDTSFGRGAFSFVLQANMVIKGWDQGLVGMKVGGRRQLLIPASLAYGKQGSGSIPPNAPLEFVIDLLKIS